jgi:hypothetical protein
MANAVKDEQDAVRDLPNVALERVVLLLTGRVHRDHHNLRHVAFSFWLTPTCHLIRSDQGKGTQSCDSTSAAQPSWTPEVRPLN